MNAKTQQREGAYLKVLPPRPAFTLSDDYSALICSNDYEKQLSAIQAFRGSIYFADGAIPAISLDPSGRYLDPFDHDNWHLYIVCDRGEVRACFRLCTHPIGITPNNLKAFEVIKRMQDTRSAGRYAAAVAELIARAQRENIGVGEVGGWAVDPAWRNCTTTATLPLAAWSLYQILGDCYVVSVATTRHQSSRILRKMGGLVLDSGGMPMPSFYDDFYRCDLEFIAYDSRRPSPRYLPLVERTKAHLISALADLARVYKTKS